MWWNQSQQPLYVLIPMRVSLRFGHESPQGTTAFTIVVTSVTAIGALIMAVVLILSGAPTALVVGAVLAALPVGPLLWCFLWLDRYEPEPRHLLAMALGWGAFVATSGALILQLIDQGVFAPSELIAASVVAPVTEEAAREPSSCCCSGFVATSSTACSTALSTPA